MSKSQLWSAVFQALFLGACAEIIYYHLMKNVYADVHQSEIWTNFTRAIDILNQNNTAKANFTVAANANQTYLLNTTIQNPDLILSETPKVFYGTEVPRFILLNLIFLPLQYYWHLWLERSFPARPRYDVAPSAGSEFTPDALEEKVVQKWMAQGRIRRASLSWWNTFVKWALTMTLGQIVIYGVGTPLLDGVWNRRGAKHIYRDVIWGLFFRPWVPLFSIRPLVSLLSFIVVPAHKRIVFMAGGDLLWNTFSAVFAGIFVPWLSKTELARVIVGNLTMEAEGQAANQVMRPVALPGSDEL